MIFTAAIVLLTAGATGIDASPPRSYARWLAPAVPSLAEHHALDAAQKWIRRCPGPCATTPLTYDARLAAAAHDVLQHEDVQPSHAFPLTQARVAAWTHGWTDGQLAGIAWRMPRQQPLGLELTRVLTSKLGTLQVNRAGIAVDRDGEDLRVVALFSLHLLKVAPLPAQVPVGQEVTLAGTAAVSPAQISLAITYPSGVTHQNKLYPESGAFVQRIATGDQAGILQVQLMVDRGHGPEVAAQFPVGVGVSPWADAPPEAPAATPASEKSAPPETVSAASEPSAEDPAAALQALVWGARAAHRLPLPQLSPQLNAVAAAHVHDMIEHAFFAHVSATQGDVTQRLAHHGLHYARVDENIAAGLNVDEVFAQWMQSPSHRANVLDPEITTMGIGLGPAQAPNRVLAVLILATLADSGSNAELRAKALIRLNTERAARGLEAFALSVSLSKVAQSHSDLCAHDARPYDAFALTQALLEKPGVEKVAADVYQTQTMDSVGTSHHVGEAFTSVGVGVTRGRDAMFVTVIYSGS